MNATRGPLDKVRGAYYTELPVAQALCRWAVRNSGERVLDPAFGGGVFLKAAALHLAELGGGELNGVELHAQAHATTGEMLAALLSGSNRGPNLGRLVCADFFSLHPGQLSRVDAVVGNPPFIRFQHFAGEQRTRALARAREAGIEVGPLAGSWVAFVAHATSFLCRGGRLAMVVPAELGHAPNARPLLQLLSDAFERTTLVAFERSLFPHLDQETVLLLAEGYGGGPGTLSAVELPGPQALDQQLPGGEPIELAIDELLSGKSSLASQLLEPGARELYRGLGKGAAVPLARLATVASGYVSGSNRHFHLSATRALEAGLPKPVLVRSLFRSHELDGLRFDLSDWRASVAKGHAGYLVQAAGVEEVPAVARFLQELTADGVPERYKARNRRPWYRIPRVKAPPLLLTAMGGERLKLLVNAACVALPNTFHVVTPRACPNQAVGALPPALPASLAAAWLSSLTRLSVELEGHSLGGGILKLDPGEARQVLLPPLRVLPSAEYERIDRMLRSGESGEAQALVDEHLLIGGLGLSRQEVDTLAASANRLRRRRQQRNAPLSSR